jgi:hypothetical protein
MSLQGEPGCGLPVDKILGRFIRHSWFFLWFVFCLGVLGFELRASLGWLRQRFFVLGIFEIVSQIISPGCL